MTMFGVVIDLLLRTLIFANLGEWHAWRKGAAREAERQEYWRKVMKPTICLDFNGVLDTYSGWKGPDFFYPPRQGVGEFLYELMQRDYKIIILTTIDAEKVWQWLRDNEIDGLVDEVTNIKPPAVVYVDDRAICFRGSFQQTLKDIEHFKAHWET